MMSLQQTVGFSRLRLGLHSFLRIALHSKVGSAESILRCSPRRGSRNVRDAAANRLAISSTQTDGTFTSCSMVTGASESFLSGLSTAHAARLMSRSASKAHSPGLLMRFHRL